MAYQPQQQQQYAPTGMAPMTNYQVSPPRQLPNNFSTRQLSPQQPSFTRNLAEPSITPSTPVKDPETKPLTDTSSTTTSAASAAAATSTTTTNSETGQLPPLPVPQQQPQQPFHFKPNQMPTHSNFMQQQNPMNQMGQMNHMGQMGQMNNPMSHMMMKPQHQQQPQQQSQQQFNMPDPVNLQYMTNVAPLSVQNIQFVPCMCPVSVTMTPDGPVPTVDKRSDDVSNYSYDSIQDISLDENL